MSVDVVGRVAFGVPVDGNGKIRKLAHKARIAQIGLSAAALMITRFTADETTLRVFRVKEENLK